MRTHKPKEVSLIGAVHIAKQIRKYLSETLPHRADKMEANMGNKAKWLSDIVDETTSDVNALCRSLIDGDTAYTVNRDLSDALLYLELANNQMLRLSDDINKLFDFHVIDARQAFFVGGLMGQLKPAIKNWRQICKKKYKEEMKQPIRDE